MAPEVETIREQLEAFLARQLPAAARISISGLERTSLGLSRENWPFDATWCEGEQSISAQLILRRDPAGSVLETDRRLEVAVLRALEGSGIPVPRVRWLDAAGEAFGRPSVIMDRLPGQADMFVLRGSLPAGRRLALAHRYGELLAGIHLLDWRALGFGEFLRDPGPGAAQAAIDEWEAVLRRQQLEAFPELELILAWLRANAPASQTTVLVHGDFKPGNSLVEGGKVVAMLDWELAHLGDPLEDVGWVTNPLRQREHTIPELWEHADLVRRWAELTGFAAPPRSVGFWSIFANFKLATISLTGVRSFVEGRADRAMVPPRGIFSVIFDQIESI